MSDSRVSGGPAHVELSGVTKAFGSVVALRGIDLSVEPRSIHALVGENGAGKSTLGNIIAGVHAPTDGEVRVLGEPVRYRTPRDALARGVTIIEQELALVPTRTVIENVLLGSGPSRFGIRRKHEAAAAFRELLALVGFELAPETIVGELGLADRQKVEIMRAVARDARLIVMDEPTAALDRREAETLFRLIRRLRDGGMTIVYVSHFLEEVLELAETVTVLRDGELVRTAPASEENVDSLVRAMLGRPLDHAFPACAPPDETAAPVVRVRDLARPPRFEQVSFDVHAGEILGLAGLVGSGRSQIARALYGAPPAAHGTIEVDGRPVDVRKPVDALNAGIALVPESRKDDGLVPARSVASNITLANPRDVTRGPLIDRARERRRTLELIAQLDIRPPEPERPVMTLSGGNQQKVLFAKSLSRRPRLFIADEPTRGVDIGAKISIYDVLASAAAAGMAVVVISSDLDELLGLCNRVLVVRAGRIVASFERAEFDKETILAAAVGAAGQRAVGSRA